MRLSRSGKTLRFAYFDNTFDSQFKSGTKWTNAAHIMRSGRKISKYTRTSIRKLVILLSENFLVEWRERFYDTNAHKHCMLYFSTLSQPTENFRLFFILCFNQYNVNVYRSPLHCLTKSRIESEKSTNENRYRSLRCCYIFRACLLPFALATAFHLTTSHRLTTRVCRVCAAWHLNVFVKNLWEIFSSRRCGNGKNVHQKIELEENRWKRWMAE